MCGFRGAGQTYTYDPVLAYGFPTQTQYPTTGTVQHIESANYDIKTGLRTSFTDQNSKTTSYSYDNMLRLTQTDYPDGGKTVMSYPQGGAGPEIWTWRYLDATTHTDLRQHIDRLGRIDRSALLNAAGSWDISDTCFNSRGLVSSVSSPYTSASGFSGAPVCSGNVESYSHDALGRQTQITHPDTNYITTAYSGNCVTTSDETGRQRKTCSDGLGRLSSVTEPDASSGSLLSDTLYQYDALDNLLCVEQHGGTSGTGCSSNPANDATSAWRVRRFSYDSLSRLLSEKNPESGTTTYSYAAGTNCTGKEGPCSKTDARNVTSW
ncbi:MAG: hypothetical protein LC130_27710, partial [Bryobacterales bacterium]|nr:hypothetical protein [Bryobacterales bacterium]